MRRSGLGILGLSLMAVLLVVGCGPSLDDDIPADQRGPAPSRSASPTTPSNRPTPSVTPSAPPGRETYLRTVRTALPELDADDAFLVKQATWTCLELDRGMTPTAAAANTALLSEDKLTTAQATRLEVAAVPNYCPTYMTALQRGRVPLDDSLDPDGQAACFWTDYARGLSTSGHQVGDIDLAYAVAAAHLQASRSWPLEFRQAWLAMTSDISTPDGLAERRRLCQFNGWVGAGPPA